MMWVGHQREELGIRFGGKEIKQVDGFVYLEGMVTEDRHSDISDTSVTSGSECLEKGTGSHVGQKNFKKAVRESPESMCYTGVPVWPGDWH